MKIWCMHWDVLNCLVQYCIRGHAGLDMLADLPKVLSGEDFQNASQLLDQSVSPAVQLKQLQKCLHWKVAIDSRAWVEICEHCQSGT